MQILEVRTDPPRAPTWWGFLPLMISSLTKNFRRPLALVTGASSGIGAALARELARDGHDLVLVARRAAPMHTLADELADCQVNVTVIAANLGVVGAACRLTGELEKRGLPPVDVLINNAGFGDYADFAWAEATKLAEMIQLHVTALTELTRALLPGMLARGRGAVLFVAGVAGFAPGPGAAVFHATKAYVLSLGEALHDELRGTGVRVTTVCPGPTRTGFLSAAGGGGNDARHSWAHWGEMTPEAVARQACAALAAGQPVLLPGWLNKLRAISLQLASGSLASALAGGFRPRAARRDAPCHAVTINHSPEHTS